MEYEKSVSKKERTFSERSFKWLGCLLVLIPNSGIHLEYLHLKVIYIFRMAIINKANGCDVFSTTFTDKDIS